MNSSFYALKTTGRFAVIAILTSDESRNLAFKSKSPFTSQIMTDLSLDPKKIRRTNTWTNKTKYYLRVII